MVFDDYEKNIDEIDELDGQDVKINPDFYVHNAIIKAQQALAKDDIKVGFLQFRVIVENIESLCRAANLITENYSQQLTEFKTSIDYIEEKNEDIKAIRLANKKFELIMKEIFQNKTISAPLKFDIKKASPLNKIVEE